MAIRVFHVDDHEAFSRQLRGILEPRFEWVGACATGEAALADLQALDPDVVLLDISLPGASGFDVARAIRERFPDIEIVFVTMHGDPLYVETALATGASGYVLKRSVASEIVTAIEQAHRGGTFISRGLASNRPTRIRSRGEP